jgi:hypothetical protein
MAPTPEVVTKRLSAAFSIMEEIGDKQRKDRTYRNEYKRYCKFMEAEGLQPDNVPVYITRDGVDLFFRLDVVFRPINKNGMNRVVSSLQWAYDSVENRGSFGANPLVVRSAVVVSVIDEQQLNYKAGLLTPTEVAGTDPHKGLKDLMPLTDKLSILRYIHHARADWGSLATSFTWGNNAAVRGASSRKMVYCDLNLSRGFGPGRFGDSSRCLLLVLRKGTVHKDNYTTDKQVGVWRHRNYLLCSVFNTALHVINDLSNDVTINFLHEDKSKRASWWDKPFLDFDTQNEESSAMKDVYKKTKVSSCKVTHNRTHAVQYAGSEGLAPWQINVFTKHMLEKLNSAYQAEMDKMSSKVMAGFGKEEPYVVDYTEIKLPHAIRYYIDLLLPEYGIWIEEHLSDEGDKSSCCAKFLFEIIPFLVEVLLQCGVYFTKEFPNHPMSLYIKVSPVLLFSILLLSTVLLLTLLLLCTTTTESNPSLPHLC